MQRSKGPPAEELLWVGRAPATSPPPELAQEKKALQRRMHPSICGLGRGWWLKEPLHLSRDRGASSLQQPPGLTCPLGLGAQRWGHSGLDCTRGGVRLCPQRTVPFASAPHLLRTPRNVPRLWQCGWTETRHLHGRGQDPQEHHRTHLLHRLTDFSWCSESVFV